MSRMRFLRQLIREEIQFINESDKSPLALAAGLARDGAPPEKYLLVNDRWGDKIQMTLYHANPSGHFDLQVGFIHTAETKVDLHGECRDSEGGRVWMVTNSQVGGNSVGRLIAATGEDPLGKGWGSLMYEAMLEELSSRGRWLACDRGTVKPPAQAMWKRWQGRTDLDWIQLSDCAIPRQLEDELEGLDDKARESALLRSPLTKAFRKKDPGARPVTDALIRAGAWRQAARPS